MTRKHYVAIARVIHYHQTKRSSLDDIIKDLADYFETDNKKFDRYKFIEACEEQS